MESPVMPPWWWCGGGEEIKEAFFNKRRILPQTHHLCQPPPARGRSGESDVGPPSSNGHGEESMATRYNCFSGSLRLQSRVGKLSYRAPPRRQFIAAWHPRLQQSLSICR
jgi:hypothetical protein